MGSAASKMSAGPLAPAANGLQAGSSVDGRSSDGSSSSSSSSIGSSSLAPANTTASSSTQQRPSLQIPPKPDMAALRAAALKSARAKKAVAAPWNPTRASPSRSKQAAPPKEDEREDGEISEDEEGEITTPFSQPPPPTTAPPSPPPPPPPLPSTSIPAPNVVRSTVVTISRDGDNGTVTRSGLPSEANGDEDEQWISYVQDLLGDGITPELLIQRGVASKYVMRACQTIVEGSKLKRGATWNQFREPARENSETPSFMGDQSMGPSRTRSPRSRSSSPDVHVAVAMGRTSSESSTEALVERMSPPPSMAPRIVSSWTPTAATEPSFANRLPPPGAIHVDSYRPLSRPSSAGPTSLPAKPSPAKPFKRGRRNRDLDGSREEQVSTLNYDDDPAPPPPPRVTPVPPPLSAQPSQTDLAETRRRALESLRKKKSATPATPVFVVPTPPPQAGPSRAVVEEAAELEREFMTDAEVPMDIDDEIEDGEIPDEPVAPVPVRAVGLPVRPTTRPGGLKRPAAEDLMDNSARPISVSRPAPNKRRAFGGLARNHRLTIVLDDDSDSDSDDDLTPPPIVPPAITIPAPFDTAALLAEKEEKIRRLKEQIAAKMLAQKVTSSSNVTPSGSCTPSVAAGVRAATKAADQVGVDGVADDVVEAAVLAAAEEQRSQHRKTHPKPQDDDDVPMDVVDDEDTSARAASPVHSTASEAPSASTSKFRPYAPLLSHYPQLDSALAGVLPNLTFDSSATSEDDMKDDEGLTIDWPLVSSIILTHRLQNDISSMWCRSEAGGGRCNDANCTDFHLERVDPTEDDLVVYVQDILALQAEHNNSNTMTADEPQEHHDAAEIAAALTAVREEFEGTSGTSSKRPTRSTRSARSTAASTSNLETTPEGLVTLITSVARKLQAR